MSDASPPNSRAIVVGIERYEAGSSWNLDGPASDAVRFMEYLNRCGVPKTNVQAYLSCLPENVSLCERANELASRVAAPTQAEIDDVIEKQLPSTKCDLLILFWAGHGFIGVSDDRRLYTADATSSAKRNVDFSALLATLRSGLYPNIPRQAVIVDACANYILQPGAQLTQKKYTTGDGMAGVEQFALYAASPGEYAKNLNSEKKGLMSRELMAILEGEAGNVWPPNFAAAAEELGTRFIALRQQGRTRQTPSTFWFRSPTKSGQYLGEMSPPVTSPVHYMPRELTLGEQKLLLDALLKVSTMRDRRARDWIVLQLRPEIGTRIDRRDNDRLDTWMILYTSRYYNAFKELLEIISLMEGQSPPMEALFSVAHALLPDEVPVAPGS